MRIIIPFSYHSGQNLVKISKLATQKLFYKMKRLFLLFTFLLGFAQMRADEGMWLLMLIKRLNGVDMQKEGLHLTPEEIYSVNNSSLKDAIVSLVVSVQVRLFLTKDLFSPTTTVVTVLLLLLLLLKKII
jgi:hypothetical protein